MNMNLREIEVLNVVCGADEPLTSTDIVNGKKGLTQSTVIAVLRKLVEQKAVRVAGITHCGKVLSRTYEPGDEAKEVIKKYYLEDFAMTDKILSADELAELVEQFRKSKEVEENDE